MIEQKHNEISDFLKCLNIIPWRDEAKSEKEDESFNIFRVLGIENKEVLTCRFLGELLDPKGSHGLNELPLKLFMGKVLGVSKSNDDDLKKASIVLEDVIDNNRRVDIVIQNGKYIYPIEVKIWAGDQDKQLYDYYKYFFKCKHFQGEQIFYLTPTGWNPSKKSKGDLNNDSLKCISFKEDISNWLNEIANMPNTSIFLKNIINQYIEVINVMCYNAGVEKTIIDAIGISDMFSNQTDKNNALMALIQILKANGDKNGKLQRQIQRAYLLKHLKYDKNNYDIFSEVEPSECKDIDKNAVLFIKKKNDQSKIVAWICVQQNLYLACKKLKQDHNQKWRDDCWIYIKPTDYNKEKFALDYCDNVLHYSGEIDISSLLSEIEL